MKRICSIIALLGLLTLFIQAEAQELNPAMPATGRILLPEEQNPEQQKPLPAGTLAPIPLKATLQKTAALPLSLENALKLAEGQNIMIDLSENTLKQRRLDYLFELSDLLPDFTLNYGQSRFVGAIQVFGAETFEVFRTSYQPQLLASYTVYPAGQNIFEIRASRQRQEAQKEVVEETRQETLRQVANAYYDLQQAYWRRAIDLETLTESQQQYDIAKARYESGLGVKVDMLQAESDVFLRRQDLLETERVITQTAQHLVQLLNLDVETNIVPDQLIAELITLVPEDMTFKAMISSTYAFHPRLQALSDLKKAAKSDMYAAIASIFPQINLNAYVGGVGASLSGLGLQRFAGIEATMNLFENSGLAKPLQIAQARTLAQAVDLNIAQTTRLLEESLVNSIAQMKTSREQVDIARKALVVAKESFNQASGRFEAGVGDILEVQNALTRLTRARSSLATSFLDYNKAQVDVLANMGALTIESATKGYQPNGQSP